MELLVEPSEVELALGILDEYEKIYVGPSRYSLMEGLFRYCNSDEVFRNILEDDALHHKLMSPKCTDELLRLINFVDDCEWIMTKILFLLTIPSNKIWILDGQVLRWFFNSSNLTAIDDIRLIIKYWDRYDLSDCRCYYSALFSHLYRTPEGVKIIFEELWEYVNMIPTIAYRNAIQAKRPDIFWLLFDKGVPIDGLEQVFNNIINQIAGCLLYRNHPRYEGYIYDGYLLQYLEPLYLAGMEYLAEMELMRLVKFVMTHPDYADYDPIESSPFRKEIKHSRKFFASRLLWTSPCFAPSAWWARTSYLLGGATYQIVDASFS